MSEQCTALCAVFTAININHVTALYFVSISLYFKNSWTIHYTLSTLCFKKTFLRTLFTILLFSLFIIMLIAVYCAYASKIVCVCFLIIKKANTFPMQVKRVAGSCMHWMYGCSNAWCRCLWKSTEQGSRLVVPRFAHLTMLSQTSEKSLCKRCSCEWA